MPTVKIEPLIGADLPKRHEATPVAPAVAQVPTPTPQTTQAPRSQAATPTPKFVASAPTSVPTSIPTRARPVWTQAPITETSEFATTPTPGRTPPPIWTPDAGDVPENLLAEGNMLLQQGRYEEARQRFRRVIELEPNNGEAWFGVGMSSERMGQLETSWLAYKKAAAQNNALPIWQESQTDVGRQIAEKALLEGKEALAQGDYAQAQQSFRIAVDYDRENYEVWRRWGEALLAQDKLDAAEQKFVAAQQLAPDDRGVMMGLVRVYKAQGRDDEADELLAAYRESRNREPKRGGIAAVTSEETRQPVTPSAIPQDLLAQVQISPTPVKVTFTAPTQVPTEAPTPVPTLQPTTRPTIPPTAPPTPEAVATSTPAPNPEPPSTEELSFGLSAPVMVFPSVPNGKPATRGDAAIMLAKKLQLQPQGESSVLDIDGHPAASAISAVVDAELMDTFPNHTFRPDRMLTRADFATLLMDVMERHGVGTAGTGSLTTPAITDVPPYHPNRTAIRLAVTLGLMQLDDSRRFEPQRTITTDEAQDAIGMLVRS